MSFKLFIFYLFFWYSTEGEFRSNDKVNHKIKLKCVFLLLFIFVFSWNLPQKIRQGNYFREKINILGIINRCRFQRNDFCVKPEKIKVNRTKVNTYIASNRKGNVKNAFPVLQQKLQKAERVMYTRV